jgi:hypothetical protein
VIILLWVYYSSLILFFGSEFTQVYATRRGSRAVPDEDAEAVTKPLPIEGRPSLTPTAAKGAIPEGGFHAPGAPVGIASFSESDSRKRDQGTRSVDKASRIPPLKAAKAAKGGKRSGRFWKPGSRRFGAASLAMSLALVTAIGFLGRLIGFLRHPRTT